MDQLVNGTFRDRPGRPTDRSRAANKMYCTGNLEIVLNPTLYASLKQAAATGGCTLFTYLLASLNVLLNRLTGQTELVVGVPATEQSTAPDSIVPATHPLHGCCAGLRTVSVPYKDNSSFREFLREINDLVRNARHSASAGPAAPGRKPNLPRPPAGPSLAMVNFDLTIADHGLLSRKAEILHPTEIFNYFDLNIRAEDSGSDLCINCGFDRDLFDPATIERWLGHWQILLGELINGPDQRLSDLPILTDAECRQLPVDWNGTHTKTMPNACIHELFEEQARANPDAVAVVFNDTKLTYGQLNQRANQLARGLRKTGVAPETLVGIYVERSLELVIGILGILKAGGAYLPLDPVYPPERIAFMLADASPKVVLTQQSLRATLPKTDITILSLDADSKWLDSESFTDVEKRVQLENLAYVIYTSGSTGKPKGTLVTHRNVARLFQATEEWFRFSARDVWTLFHSHAFDFSVWELWGALAYGGRLVVVPFWVSRSPNTFYELLSQERVTVLNQTPSAFRQLLHAEETRQESRSLALRLVIFGGEALEMHSLKPWFDRHGDECPRLVNMYGITETTVHVTYRVLSKADLNSGSVIGIPIPDLKIYVLDGSQKPVPTGVPGELYVGGAGVARGYLNRPELTAEKFLPNPFTTKEGDRLYRSGDLARYLPNRDLEYLGRIDDQVKIRGFRIELGEIESKLSQCPSVREAVVVAREQTPGDKRLVAYITPKDTAPNVGELQEFLKAALPEYMVPSAFVILDRLPLSPNGKVDRKALPAPTATEPSPGNSPIPPGNDLEQTIATIWRDILKKPHIGLDQNFFEAGGDSIRLASAHARLQELLGRQFPVTDLFTHTTIRSLARHFGRHNGSSRTTADASLARAQKQRQALSGQKAARRFPMESDR
jgi:amino acid adenylation domain-containing protein